MDGHFELSSAKCNKFTPNGLLDSKSVVLNTNDMLMAIDVFDKFVRPASVELCICTARLCTTQLVR